MKAYTGWTLALAFLGFQAFLLRAYLRRPVELRGLGWSDRQDEPRKKAEDEPLIDSELTERILEKLNIVMEQDKVFRQPDLSLSGLAKKLDTNDKYLRYVLGTKHTGGFVSFVNQYRVEDAKEMLIESEYNIYTVESIGQMSGFKSKSSFYTAFKEVTGKTPFQFRQERGKEVM